MKIQFHWNFKPNLFVCFAAILVLTGCSILPTSGPSRKVIQSNKNSLIRQRVALVTVTDAVAQRLAQSVKPEKFSLSFGTGSAENYAVGRGDVLNVTLWEAPPAMLFGGAANSVTAGGSLSASSIGGSGATTVTLPPQIVNANGTIVVPYAGMIHVAERSTDQIEAEIVHRLSGKANQPQALVQVATNASSTVTVVGEVKSDMRMPLTPKGERLLDALAAAGGSAQPVNKTTIQLSRHGETESMPLASIIADPAQNVLLHTGDVITAVSQPLSFTVLGASGKSDEINFEATGITLAQALGRASGLQDNRADAAGVFIFRFENPNLFSSHLNRTVLTHEGEIPTIYRVNLKDPASFFAMQHFPIRDKDVIYVANAPAAELQKFLNVVLSGVYPIVTILNGNW
jgi:polysaccharide export outer membrane protein